jgi:pimeloyl-[acyl-carrier protein] methyl ester esterase
MSQYADADGARLAVRAVGQGPDLVLLHGWGLSGRVWGAALAPLADACRLHVVDLPGHGESRGLALAGLDESAERLLDALPAGAVWLGWSLGGLLAIAAALNAPGRVARVVTVATNPRFLRSADWDSGLEPAVLEDFAAGLEDDYAGTLGRFVALQTRGLADARQALRSLRASLAENPPQTGSLRAGLAMLRDTDLRSRLAELGPRLAMGFGGRDTLVPASAADAVARLAPQAAVERVVAWGHAPFVSDPGGFGAWVLGHVAR